MRTVLFLVLAGVALAFAQVPKPCVSPDLWEARLLEIDPSKTFERRGKFSYDAVNNRTSIFEEIDIGTQREFYHDIALFKEKILYRYNLRTKQCNNYTLNDTFRRIEVPPTAKLFGQFYIGSNVAEGAGILVSAFGGDTERGRYVGTWTAVGCAPVTDAYFSQRTGFVHWSFYDVTLGISDPNVFVPPAECRQQ